MAEKNWPVETETKELIDFNGYHAKDDNNENGIRKLFLKLCHYEILSKIYTYSIYMKCQILSIYYA